MRAAKIALIGECMIELNGEPFGSMTQSYGGDVLNSAVYLARAGKGSLDVYFVTAMGVDPLSCGMITRWQQEGINTSLVLIDSAHQPGLYLIQLDEQGERTFLYWRNNSAARYLLRHADYPKICQQLEGMDALYLSGITLAILPEEDRQLLLNDLKKLSSQGKTIFFDSNYRPALWESVAQARECYQKMYAITDIALVTDDDELQLWGEASTGVNLMSESFNRLQKMGVKQAIIKAGAKGCFYRDLREQAEMQHIAAEPVATVVDTTAAGDAFNAGFISGLLNGQSIHDSALLGHELAGVVIQHKGAIVSNIATWQITGCFNVQKSHKK
ncbi:ribokinase [Xenorhabdus mauleonii]|uniref:2-dehydro-3-deoxygluconokinase n=1 Tax=Xenorhabdus mauleonii TaxID=351675 RepID=A0A1I3KIU5_9GAMM|nr:sugar kinase [Xenorhabdus mauleonii]PHM45066.1 ribokinase [Xenorhabdus mauleonii]SFI72402.1 2-keto-3-deoxygluconate kinase [Xenorhabdus mauleonii]